MTYKGAKLYDWQRKVADEICSQKGTGKIVVVKSHRQAGKSLLCENILLHYAINYAKSKNAIISPVLSQSRKIYREIVDAIAGSGVISKKNETLLEITLINGSTIIFRSGEMGDSLRGEHITGILIWDEAAFLSDKIAELTLPWLQVHHSPLLIVSTPKFKEGIFYKYYMRGLEGDNNIVSIDWNQYDTSALLSEEIKQQYRQVMTTAQYQSEVLGEWLDDDGQVFSGFRDCIGGGDIESSEELYVGIDWSNGGGNDYTVISIVNGQGQQVFLDYWNISNTSQQIDRLEQILGKVKNKIVVVEPELNSLGTPYTDLLRDRLQTTNIEGFNTSNKSKGELVTDLQLAFEQKEISILEDEKQLRELSIYQAELNLKTKTISYNAPQGLNDDTCIALMLSWNAYKKYNKQNCYTFSF